MTLTEIRAEMAKEQKRGEELGKRAEDAGGWTPEATDELRKINASVKELFQKAESLKEQEAAVSEWAGLKEKIGAPANAPVFPGAGKTPESQGDALSLAMKTLGDRFIENPAYQSWFKSVAPAGEIPDGIKIGQGPPLISGSLIASRMERVKGALKAMVGEPGSLNADALKALVVGTSAGAGTGAGALFLPQFLGLPDPQALYHRQLTVLDLVRRIPVSVDTVEYARVGTPTIAAAPVAEATATSGSTGAKPESSLPFTLITENIRNIAHWIPVTRRALADANQIRALIDDFMAYGLQQALEDEIIAGAGTGQHLTGIVNVSGHQTRAWASDNLTTTRKAITDIQVNARTSPTGWVFHPADWETFDLALDNEARFYFMAPNSPIQGGLMMTPRLWGLPVTLNLGVTAGNSILADWRWIALLDREQAATYVTDSHLDFFIRNIITILTELRAGLAVFRPKAINVVAVGAN